MVFIVYIVCILLQHEKNLKSDEKVCENEDFCGIVMPSAKDNILEFNQYMKSDKVPLFMFTLNL